VLTLILSIKLLTEIAMLALLGRALLGGLIGAQRECNAAYRLLHTLSQPLLRAARWLTPRWVLERHLPWAAGGLLLTLWLLVTLLKIRYCLVIGIVLCH